MFGKIYSYAKSFLLSLLFPRVCLGCGIEGRWICDDCLKTIDTIKIPFCPRCRRPTEIGEFCNTCRGGAFPPALEGILICANFEEGVLREAVHQFKYNHIFDIGGILGRIMAARLKSARSSIPRFRITEKPELEDEKFWHFDLVIPVPLHRKRLRERGFNQAKKLAQVICNTGGLVLGGDVLVRKKYTVSQAELGREERLKNLEGAFEINKSKTVLQEKNILLVDDITTTGATLEECAKALKAKGAGSVWAIVLAKGK